MNVEVNSFMGSIPATVVGEIPVNGKPYVVVDLGSGAFVRGVYTKFAVIPAHQIMNRNIEDVRVYEND